MNQKAQFLQAMHFRRACKLFDTQKKITPEDQKYILEVGRLSPSSRGLEQWGFIVLQSEEMKQKLQLACLNQPQVGTACFNMIILAKIADLHPESTYIDKIFSQRFGNEKENRKERYHLFYNSVEDIKLWSISQCYIAATNMMTAAAFIGIDSCPIGGFESEKVRALLNTTEIKTKEINIEGKEIALILCFGYRAKEPWPRNRLPFEEIVKFID